MKAVNGETIIDIHKQVGKNRQSKAFFILDGLMQHVSAHQEATMKQMGHKKRKLLHKLHNTISYHSRIRLGRQLYKNTIQV